MTPCSALSGTRRFGGTYRLHLQGLRIVQQRSEQASARRLVFDSGAAAVCNGKVRHKSWLQSWIRSLQRKRIDSIVVSYKVYTL
jgi:hypothetical protein